MSEQQPQDHEGRDHESAGREPDGEYTDTENEAGQREEPPAEPSGSFVDVDETHVVTGTEGQYVDADGEQPRSGQSHGHFTDADQ